MFSALAGRRYDVIVTNPPYVGSAELAGLPDEYQREPRLGLYGGDDGLDIVRRILRGRTITCSRTAFLSPKSVTPRPSLVDAFPRVPFTWLEFEHGGGGVFLLTAEQLKQLATGG